MTSSLAPAGLLGGGWMTLAVALAGWGLDWDWGSSQLSGSASVFPFSFRWLGQGTGTGGYSLSLAVDLAPMKAWSWRYTDQSWISASLWISPSAGQLSLTGNGRSHSITQCKQPEFRPSAVHAPAHRLRPNRIVR